MGGRGASSGGVAGGGGVSVNAQTTSLVSAREGKRAEVDQTLAVLRQVQQQYGLTADLNDVQLATLDKKNQGVLAYYDINGNLAMNESYFDTQKMNGVYDSSVQSGFHPSRGDKTGIEAVAAHEMGHRLSDVAAQKLGYGDWQLDKVSNEIVRRASKATGASNVSSFRSAISGYATHNNAETVAEAFADVYCNGKNARRESQAVVSELNKILR